MTEPQLPDGTRRVRREGKGQPNLFPLSFAQERMWLLDRLEPGNPVYNITRVFRIRGVLSPQALQGSLNEIVARHESLRTTFAEVDGDLVQIVAAHGALDLETIDLSFGPEPQRESRARRLVCNEAQRPFDLGSGPLMRAQLVRMGPDEHLLVLVLHHIVTDGWSMSVLFKEMGRLYEAFAKGQSSPLPDLPLQYAEFASWQRREWKGEVLEEKLAYWRARLAGVDPVLELPTDRSRPRVRTARGSIQSRVFSKSLRERLKALGREENATLFMTLLAAFLTLLWRYTGRDDLTIGTPSAGRREVELESLIGFFVNTLVIRANLSGNPTFREFLARIREIALEAVAHEEAPFEQVIESMKLLRNLAHNPLFQVMFILQNIPKQRLELQGLTLEELEVDPGTAKLDLTVEMAEVDDGLWCGFEYSTDLFEPATVTRMLGHFETLLEAIGSEPGQRLSALPLMADAERNQILLEWNDTERDYPRDRCIHDLFETQAARSPEAVALIYRNQHVTYGELNSRANQLAHHLRRKGVERGVLVGISVERSIEAVVGLLGILKAGGAYVAMDPAYPRQRLAFMLEDSRVPVLLSTKRLLDRLPTSAAQVICLDADWESIASESSANPERGVRPEDIAYVMYTSGSTGTPKGVLAPHRASVNRFAWMWDRWAFAPNEVCCQKTALSFVDSVWEIFGPLLQKVPNVILPDEVFEEPARLVDTLAEHRVTRIVLVPSFLRFLLDSFPDLGSRIPELKFWITSGEAIAPDLAKRLKKTLPDASVINLYGSSEVAADVTWYVIRDTEGLERIPIGRPIANSRVYVLDRFQNPASVGVPGEIHVGGDGLASGYLNNPELTARKFIPDPFAAGARIYKTGDLGRFLPDGNVEFLGRVDDQIKIRGIRIELGEIETVLRSHPSVQAAVVALRGNGGGERLIGYVVAGEGAPAPGDLRSFARDQLPDYMVPASFVFLSSLPLLPNGKVNRRALPPPDRDGAQIARAYAPPRNPTEEKLVTILTEVLAVERMGIEDNFFELGGHSLSGIRFLARVRKLFQVELSLRILFQEPTVAGLAREIERAREQGYIAVAPPIRRNRREQLLARIAGLSDEAVTALLETTLGNGQDKRETEDF